MDCSWGFFSLPRPPSMGPCDTSCLFHVKAWPGASPVRRLNLYLHVGRGTARSSVMVSRPRLLAIYSLVSTQAGLIPAHTTIVPAVWQAHWPHPRASLQSGLKPWQCTGNLGFPFSVRVFYLGPNSWVVEQNSVHSIWVQQCPTAAASLWFLPVPSDVLSRRLVLSQTILHLMLIPGSTILLLPVP